MATKNYMINDKWLDLDKQNIVELQSVDGELDTLKVNGSEIVTPSGKITITENGTDIDIAQYALADVNVEGGGGSSDFSIAEVTIIDNAEIGEFSKDSCPTIVDGILYGSAYADTFPATLIVPLYKGKCVWALGLLGITISGNIEPDDEGLLITGDGTITLT